MIWVTDRTGNLAYICEEWHRLTGQTPGTSLGFGWLDAVHADDRSIIAEGFARACEHRVEFMMRYRLRRFDGSYIWVIDAATPSFAPLTHDFIGFLGLVSCYEDDASGLTTKVEVGALKPGQGMAQARPASRLDVVADHLIMARAAATGTDPAVTTAIDDALHAAGHALVVAQQARKATASLH